MTEDPSHELATAEEWNRARHRETVLRSLLTQSTLSETDIQIASKQMGVRRAYFYRLFAAYKLCPKTSTLLSRAGGRPSGLHLLPANTESLVHKCIEDFYMSGVWSSRKYSANTSLPASSNRSQSHGPDCSR